MKLQSFLRSGRNVTSVSLFYGYYFGRSSFELAELFPLSYSHGRSTRYSDRLPDCYVIIPNVKRMLMPTVPFLAELDSGILCLQNTFL